MYRNVYFDRKNSIIHNWTYDDSGNPIKKEIPYKPYVYVKAQGIQKPDAIGIDDVPLVKKVFDKEWERRKFCDAYKGKLYLYLPPTQQYLLETFYQSDILDLTKYPLRTFFYDIEVIADEFPDAKEAKFPITSITIFDSLTKKFYVWGDKPYDPNSCKLHLKDIEPSDIVYEYCVTEKALLKQFVTFWRKNFPDVIVGYNSSSFDLPYIVHRIRTVFGEEKIGVLSPVNHVYGIEKINLKFGYKYTEYTIEGVSHLDYMILYKTFTPGERESDSLDFVCWDEIGIGKLDYGDMSLRELYHKDWTKFVNYNIWDVKLLMLLDEKRKYLEIAKFSAFSGFCNLNKAFGKTAIITGVLAKQSLQKGKIIPTQVEGDEEDIPGGYVKQPNIGLYEDVISYDANSLYPSVMITLNLSPETKVGKVIKKTDSVFSIYLFRDRKVVDVKKDELMDFIKKNNWAMSNCGVFFDQKEKSVSAQFVDNLYSKRKAVKDKMFKIEKQTEGLDKRSKEYKQLKLTSSQLDTEQYLYKILLNSIYGAFGNRFFSLYDADCAKSITTTGQAMIKASEKFINEYLEKEWNLDKADRVVGMDTDSILLSIKDLGIKLIDEKGDLTPEFVEAETKIGDYLNDNIKEWAKEKLNSADPRFFFKRESVCPKAIWTGKKHYILYLVNKEGQKMDKFKYSGMMIAKSTWSTKVKDISKNIAKTIMINKDKKIADDLVINAFDNFAVLDINDIAERGSIKVLDKWQGKNNEFITAKGTTRQAKYSIWHNLLLKNLKLQNKYRKIENGSKIKMVFIKDNIYNIDGVAYQDEFPKDFNFGVDYEAMFFKGVLKCLEPIYKAMGWNLPDPKKQYEHSLEDLFS